MHIRQHYFIDFYKAYDCLNANKAALWDTGYIARTTCITHRSKMTHICVSELGHPWFRKWLVSCSVLSCTYVPKPLHWRCNDHDGVSNHQPNGCLQSFIQAQIKENIKAPRHWPLCREFTGTGEFAAQRAGDTENVSIWWRHNASELVKTHCRLTTWKETPLEFEKNA